MSWFTSYLPAKWELILLVVLAIAVLSALAFFVRNWKAALAALIVLGAGLAYQAIDRAAYQRRVDEEKAIEISMLKGRLATLEKLSLDDANRAQDDAEYISDLERISRETPANSGMCLDAAAADRVRAIR